MQLDFLWTDYLVWLLVILVVGFVVYASRHEHLRAPWRQIIASPMGIVAGMVLILYVVIGLSDSIHFYSIQSAEQKSLLDLMMPATALSHEKTYSKPFALTLYTKQTVTTDAGEKIRIYPPLKHISALDEQSNIIASFVVAGFAALFLFFGASYFTKSRHKVFFATASMLLFIVISLRLLCSDYHILGTGKVGHDIFYLALKSIRTGLVLGTVTTLVMLPFALLLGALAGYYRGWVDDVIQYLYTTLSSVPGVLLIAAMVLSLQIYMNNHSDFFATISERADARLLALCVILGITSWTSLCRLIRAETLKIREMDYVTAATALGVSQFKIILRHILPNVMHIVLITIVLDFSGLVLAEAVLSYVGVGVDPTTHSWGNMINAARLEMARDPIVWWPLFAAFLFMFFLVLAANCFADVVRDAFDPRVQRTV